MKGMAIFCAIAFALSAAATSGADDPIDVSRLPPAATGDVDFVRDIQSILARSCLKCHGSEEQESSYRLDAKEIALTGGEASAPNIVPGKSADSPLIHLVAGALDGMRMPPEGDPLSDSDIGLLRRWIDQGAPWPASASAVVADKLDWWSLRSLHSPPLPRIRHRSAGPIDVFVDAKLDEKGWRRSKQAPRSVLARRLSFDLTGLPPEPAEVRDFVNDESPDACERLVDRLLASPRHGERWARHWMDAVHFAETHGHDQDRVRENAWPYRDYLIASFNADKPYERFVQEQIAGDALFSEDPQATVALGFLAAGPWDESSLRDIREDSIDREIGRYLDRDDVIANTMNAFVGMTVQCARCHDHKFDPISQEDYFALQAVFAGVERANRVFDEDPAVHRTRQAIVQRRRGLRLLDPATRNRLLSSSFDAEILTWAKSFGDAPLAWRAIAPQSAASSDGSRLEVLDDGSVLASSDRPERDTYTITLAPNQSRITAVRLEALADDRLPMKGPGRQDNGNFHLSEIELYVGSPSNPLPIARAWASFNQADWEINKAIDGNPQTAWGVHPEVGKSQTALFELKEPLILSKGDALTVVLKQAHGGGHLIGKPRLSLTDQPIPTLPFGPGPELAAILATPRERRPVEDQLKLASAVEAELIAKEWAKLPKPSFIYAAASEFEPDGGLKPPAKPRAIHVLKRGDIRQPITEARPGSLSCFSALPTRFDKTPSDDESARRAHLARWMTHRDNPLVWRTIVNRIWHHHFGRGIASTPSDLGHMGDVPTHPELLDWLAVEFRDSDQSLKRLHRQIVISQTYQQSSHSNESLDSSAATQDADNKYLWRQNRVRLDAECIRDAVLAASGQLDLTMGGPSDRHFDLKPGRHVTPLIDYSAFDIDGPLSRRRSVYRFLFRTLPDPFMEALDCPAGDQAMPVRPNSVTVQQALALWNNAFMLRHCEYFASRLRSEHERLEDQTAAAFRILLVREPLDSELARFSSYAQEHGLENACRVLMNSNEFVYVE